MSQKQTPLRELRQPPTTPSHHRPPSAFKSERRVQSARSVRTRQNDQDDAFNPNSARGILRRLARIEAKTTQRRIITPSAKSGPINSPAVEDVSDDEQQTQPKFALEDSIEEIDSDPLIAPTPSALVEDSDSDSDDAQPTVTFMNESNIVAADLSGTNSNQPTSNNQYIISRLYDQYDEEDPENGEPSTFLTERGRRAASEDHTRISRYSFGSIRMSEFGSELEVRRQSDRQDKLTELEADDADGDMSHNLDQETQDLRRLQRSSPSSESSDGGQDGGINVESDDFELPFNDDGRPVEEDPSHVEMIAHQLLQRQQDRLPLVSAQEEAEEAQDIAQEEVMIGTVSEESEAVVNQPTLLDNIIAAANPPRKKRQKLNALGNMVPALPSNLIKKIVHQSQEKAGKRKTTLGKEHMKALEQASEWFFEQMGTDLEAYSNHGRKRQRITTADVLLLMKRQRITSTGNDLRQFAKDWLPREIRAELDLPDKL